MSSSHSQLVALLTVGDVIHGSTLVAVDESRADLSLTFAKDGVTFDVDVKAETGWILLSREIRALAAKIQPLSLAA